MTLSMKSLVAVAIAAVLPFCLVTEVSAKSGQHGGGEKSHEKDRSHGPKPDALKKKDEPPKRPHLQRREPGVIENALSVETNVPEYDAWDAYSARRPRYGE